ncbi:3-phosphoshikimate 1-carboxyvinyltransferase [Leuconostocaceae bacterium ESL0723]|nr:3-phosphoshikimate 1-carboxyvinyltransferase [Leuconostocaceae bacterium ESL0723]
MITLQAANPAGLHGTLTVPGDKSISHRALMFGAIAHGQTRVHNFLTSADVLHTMGVLRALGVEITQEGTEATIEGRGLKHFTAPTQPLDMGNSGTSTRLLMGLLAKQPFDMEMFGDASLSRRPLDRVAKPLTAMGAKYQLTDDNYLPGKILANQELRGIEYHLPVASAQVKSAILLAGLQAEGTTTVISPLASRDHTERMLEQFGGHLQVDGLKVSVQAQDDLQAQDVTVPADISSAAFFIVAAIITPNSKLSLRHVGVNPTRDGILRLLKRMGAEITLSNPSTVGEPAADLTVASQKLAGITITAEDIPAVVDELPILALAATQAQGDTLISGAEELRVKETDRIAVVVETLNQLGADIEERPDGMLIHGGTPLKTSQPVELSAHGDHRIAMMIAVAALVTDGTVRLQDEESMAVSYPNFLTDLAQTQAGEV